MVGGLMNKLNLVVYIACLGVLTACGQSSHSNSSPTPNDVSTSSQQFDDLNVKLTNMGCSITLTKTFEGLTYDEYAASMSCTTSNLTDDDVTDMSKSLSDFIALGKHL